jgi:branched-chain amino acid transport system substrate-binding protein
MAIAAPGASAAEFAVGLAAPLDEPNTILGLQMMQGARAAGTDTATGIVVADDKCSAESGEAAARRFVEQEVRIAVGFLCTETIEAALPILSAADIPTITTAVRTDSLTDRSDRTGWNIFRLAPRADAESAAVGTLLVERWRDELFAIVDDGTIYGRELAESFRLEAELAGLRPVFIDTYRPQMENQIGLLGRLSRAGATHVFVGGDREDIAVMARDAATLDYAVVIAGGEALRAAPGEVALADGVLMIAPPDWSELASPSALASLDAADVTPVGYVLPTYAAVEVAALALAAADDAGEGADLRDILRSRDFPTLVGTIGFDDSGNLEDFAYRIYRHQDGRFIAVE